MSCVTVNVYSQQGKDKGMGRLHMVSAHLVEPGDTIRGDHIDPCGDMLLTVYAVNYLIVDKTAEVTVHGWDRNGTWVKRHYVPTDVVAVEYDLKEAVV